MRAGGQRRKRELARMDRAVVLHQHDWLDGSARFGTVEGIKLLKVSHEVAAALGRAGVDDKVARGVIERSQHCHLLGLPRRRHAQVRARARPRSRKIGMCQRLALLAIQEDDVAGFGLALAQVQAQADPVHPAGALPPFQRVRGPPPAEGFFRNALLNRDRLMRTPALARISARRRAIVQFGRSATGASSKGVSTRNAVWLFTGEGHGASVAFNASTPPRLKSLRHSRTVSSRTPNASPIRGLVQPDSVNRVGYDVLSRTIHGAPTVLAVGLGAMLIASVIGVVVGGVAGYAGGLVDEAPMRATEFFMVVPVFVVILAVVRLFGIVVVGTALERIPNLNLITIIVLLGLFGWPSVARMTRAEFLRLRRAEFVEAALCIGKSRHDILVRHILPTLCRRLPAC